MKKEIGGYFELACFHGQELYPDLFKLNLGRTALIFMLEQMHIHTLYVPRFLCGSVLDTCLMRHVALKYYAIDKAMRPVFDSPLSDGEGFYLVNLYGQLTEEELLAWAGRVGSDRLIVDHTHAFFQRSLPGVPALYSIRKFFGLSDGAYVTFGTSEGDAAARQAYEELPQDHSSGRMTHILGRYEYPASEFYQAMLDNAHSYDEDPQILKMSALTENLLRGIDYDYTKKAREKNFRALHDILGSSNRFPLRMPDGPFTYPFYCPDGLTVRRAMAKEKIFVPTYWGNVLRDCPPDSIEYDYAANILPLPCDQRYNEEDMERVAAVFMDCAGDHLS